MMPGMNPPATTFTFFHAYGCDGTLVAWLKAVAGTKPADRTTVHITDRKDIWILFKCIGHWLLHRLVDGVGLTGNLDVQRLALPGYMHLFSSQQLQLPILDRKSEPGGGVTRRRIEYHEQRFPATGPRIDEWIGVFLRVQRNEFRVGRQRRLGVLEPDEFPDPVQQRTGIFLLRGDVRGVGGGIHRQVKFGRVGG